MRKKILCVALVMTALTGIAATAQSTVVEQVEEKTEQIKNRTEKIVDQTATKAKEVTGKVKKEVKGYVDKAGSKIRQEESKIKQPAKHCGNKCDSTTTTPCDHGKCGYSHDSHNECDGNCQQKQSAAQSAPKAKNK